MINLIFYVDSSSEGLRRRRNQTHITFRAFAYEVMRGDIYILVKPDIYIIGIISFFQSKQIDYITQ